MLLLMKKIKQRSKASNNKKKIDRHDSKYYWPTSIIEYIQFFTFMTIMEHTVDKIDTHIRLLPLLLKVFTMFNILIWWVVPATAENLISVFM